MTNDDMTTAITTTLQPQPWPAGTLVVVSRRNGTNRPPIVVDAVVMDSRRCAGRIDYLVRGAEGSTPWWCQARKCERREAVVAQAQGGAQ